MPTPEKLADHYRKLAAEEVAMVKVALTNERHAAPIVGRMQHKTRQPDSE